MKLAPALALVLLLVTIQTALAQSDDSLRLGPGETPPRGETLPPPPEPVGPVGRTATALEVTAYWVPALTVDTGIEHDAFGFSGRPEADVKTGRGFGGRVAVSGRVGSARAAALGLLYVQTEHRERTHRAFVREHLGFLEARGTLGIPEVPVSPYLGLSLGLGGGSIHFDKVFRDGGGAAGEIGLIAGLRIVEHVDIEAGVLLYVLGYPSNTVGTGVFFPLGVTIRF